MEFEFYEDWTDYNGLIQIVTVQVVDRDANETVRETFFEWDLPTPVSGGQPYYY